MIEFAIFNSTKRLNEAKVIITLLNIAGGKAISTDSEILSGIFNKKKRKVGYLIKRNRKAKII